MKLVSLSAMLTLKRKRLTLRYLESKYMKTKQLLICEASSSEHQIILKYFESDDQPFVYVDVHLVEMNFWDRLKHAIGYVLGYKSKFGAYDEIVLGPEHIKNLEEVIAHIKKADANKLQLNIFDGTKELGN